MSIKKIAVIGLGGIGFRHFQSLCQIDIPVTLQLVDISEEALKRAEKYFSTIKNEFIKDVILLKDIKGLSNELDLGIIATSSNNRREILEELLLNTKIDYLLLEKVLFTKIKDFEIINNLFEKKNIKAWVNCSRRAMDSYQILREQLKENKNYKFIISGDQWGLGCNSIHMIDLIDYLSGGKGKVICSGYLLNDKIYESKRKGFIEFNGMIVGTIGDNINFSINSNDAGENEIIIYIYTDTNLYIINELLQKIIVFDIKNPSNNFCKQFEILYQSELTSKVAKSILLNGECSLTDYKRSSELHVALLQELLYKKKSITKENTLVCEIT